MTTASQQDAVEFETLADAIARPQVSSIARNTMIVAFAFIASRILGFIREILIARQFGTGPDASAYSAAFRLPDLLFLVVMSAGFGSAFIPVFAGYLTRDDDRGAWRLASSVLTWAIGLTLLAGVLIFVLADPIIRYLIAPDLSDESIALSASLMRILVLSPLLLGLGIAAKGILEAQDRFLMPALAPLVYNAGIIAGIVLLAPALGIRGVAIGVIIGAAAHASIQLPAVVKSGLRFRPSFSRSVEGLSEVARLLVPRVIGQVAFAANFIVITNFASSLGEGGPASINYAWQLLMLPHGILALSISTVIFPAMARQWERSDVAGLNRTFSEAIRPLIFLSVPVSIVLFLYREPIVAALLQRGSFTRESTVAVAAPLAALALGLVSYGLVEVLTRAFYAMKDARTPVAAGLVIIAINIAIVALTIDRLDGLALGLALALSTTVEAIILLVVLIARLRALGVAGDGAWLLWLGRVAFATLVALGFGLVATSPLERLWAAGGSSYVVRAALLVIAVGLVLVPYFLVAWATAIPEVAPLQRRLVQLSAPLGRFLPGSLMADLGIRRGLPLDRSSSPTVTTDQELNTGATAIPGGVDGGAAAPASATASRRTWPDPSGRTGHGEREWLYRDDPPESRTDGRRRRSRRRSPEFDALRAAPERGSDHPWRWPDEREDHAGTGRFGNGRTSAPSRRRDPDDRRYGSGSGERAPFRSSRQPTMPSWYTPSRRERRSSDVTDYNDDSSGRSNRPRYDR